MTFIDFFAGIGGFRRGMELAGHTCVGFCEYDPYAVLSYIMMHLISNDRCEQIASIPAPRDKRGIPKFKDRRLELLRKEHRNDEWYARDVRNIDVRRMPKADCWCFGFPCQDISIAGPRFGFSGERSSLFFAVTGLVRKLKEEDRPKYLFIENVRNLLSVNNGLDFARLLIELDEIGYDAQWQVVNSKDFGVPHNRERIFIVGHSRAYRDSRKEIFPLQSTASENHIRQLVGGKQGQHIYDPDGISITLSGQGGGQGAKTGLYAFPFFIDLSMNNAKITEHVRCLKGAYRGLSNRAAEASGVMQKAEDSILENAVWLDAYGCYVNVRRLTPRECFRLQGWGDTYFERAALINTDSQLIKQAGNGVTVNVIEAIANRM